MAQFVQGGSAMVPRLNVSIANTSFVGLTNSIAYLIGTDGTLISTGAASAFAATNLNGFLRSPYLIDLGTDQPRGVALSFENQSGTLVSIAGGNLGLVSVEPGSPLTPWVNATAGIAFAGATYARTWFPPTVVASTAEAVNAAILFPRFCLVSVFATTWAASATGTTQFRLYA